DRRQRFARLAAGAIDQARCEALRIVEQDLQDVLGRKLLVAFAQGERLGGLDESAGTVGVLFKVHRSTPSACSARPDGTRRTSSPEHCDGALEAPLGPRTAIPRR